LRTLGVDLVSHSQAFDSTTPMGKFTLTMFAALVLAAALAMSAHADTTMNYTGCRDWNEYSESLRGGYVIGFAEGISSFPAAASDPRQREVELNYFAPGINFGELKDGITEICKRPENSLVPVSLAFEAFIKQVRGKPQSEIDDFLNFARRTAIKLQPADESKSAETEKTKK
jgi:hypothetical protein